MSIPKLVSTATHVENQLKPTYDALINSLEAQVQFYQKEHESLRCQIIDLTSTPQRIEPGECCCDCTTDLQKHKQLTDGTITNLQEQLRLLNEERDIVNTLWRTSEKTLTNLEVELAEYKRLLRQPDSVLLVKKQFAAVTRAYEANVAKLKSELSAQTQINARLTESKAFVSQQLATIDEKYKSFLLEHSKSLNEVQQSENILNLAKSRLADVSQHRNDLEKQLNETKMQLQEYVERESVFLSKIQEVLQLADAAVLERSTAEQRELDTRDECEHLATTIGQVMEEAANACERSIHNWQKQYEQRIKQFRDQINNLTTTNSHLTSKLYAIESRGTVLEGNLKTVLQINTTLDAELQIASKTIIEMEIKLQAFEKLLDQEKEAKQITDERAQELHSYLVQNNKLKQRWKTTVDETMAKLQSEVTELHAQNVALQREKDLIQAQGKETVISNNRGYFRTFSTTEGS